MIDFCPIKIYLRRIKNWWKLPILWRNRKQETRKYLFKEYLSANYLVLNTLQNPLFSIPKQALLRCKRACFGNRKRLSWKMNAMLLKRNSIFIVTPYYGNYLTCMFELAVSWCFLEFILALYTDRRCQFGNRQMSICFSKKVAFWFRATPLPILYV